MEILGLIVGLVALIIAALTYYKTFKAKPKEEIDHLRAQFKATQTLSKNVERDLEYLIQTFALGDAQLYPGIKFRSYLREVQNKQEHNLSDELLDKVTKLNLTKSNVVSMTKSLEVQFDALSQVQAHIDLMKNELHHG